MSFHVDESLRMRRLAAAVAGCDEVLDLGWAQIPNRFLCNRRVVGFDLDDAALPGNYHAAVTGDVRKMRHLLGTAEFDAIVAGEIIEHVEDPYGFLRDCHHLLRAGGKLALSTPNPNSPIERLLTLTLNRKFFYTREHLCLYPQRWLIRMLENCGFKDVRLRSGGFPLPFIGTVPFPRPWCHQTIAIATKAG
ncbi:class I SAM-dependent methyltransferase [Marilutibacter chinensis]|uniref:Class I SAM-dependent methyltransferase n=1 Tax=Marilutibacter chinensis TaxID=2912247 RepID=A0ABS9HT14_9GAMM|nr:class I SAM-dependent methyltransferase [Lysobacter chinensis]MCF7222044.1 class I SAM-dependent methyltransferase [Lysobacter chinensis]